MNKGLRSLGVAAIAAGFTAVAGLPASAGSESGNVMVRVQGAVVIPDSSAEVSSAGVVVPSFDAEVSTEVIPALTLSYFLNKNVAIELFCCFAKFNAEGRDGIDGVDLGSFWVFPPALTLQYHFDNMGGFKPYVGAGVQYIAFFNQDDSVLAPGAQIQLDDAFGFTLQAGVDVSVGGGWYLNADVKKTWINTDASWAGTPITAKVDIDPWIISAGLGYRFNLDDLIGGH